MPDSPRGPVEVTTALPVNTPPVSPSTPCRAGVAPVATQAPLEPVDLTSPGGKLTAPHLVRERTPLVVPVHRTTLSTWRRRTKGSALTDPRACIFCGQRPLTDEHVWPQWLSGVISLGKMVDVSRASGAEGVANTRQSWTAPPFTTTVKRVCERCNTGWMSRLEDSAKPLLTPMISGQSAVLSPDDQRVVAIWAFKTILMFQWTHADREVYVPQEHYQSLYSNGKVPDDVTVSLGKNRLPYEVVAFYAHKSRTSEPSDPSDPIGPQTDYYGASLVIGRLMVDTLSFVGMPNVPRPELLPASRGILRTIWPAERTIRWPPPQTMHRHDLRMFGLTE